MQEKTPSFEAAVESIKQALEKVCVFFCCCCFFLARRKRGKRERDGLVSWAAAAGGVVFGCFAVPQAESSNPGMSHDFVDLILEKTQSKGGMDLTEKLLREAHRDVDCESQQHQRP